MCGGPFSLMHPWPRAIAHIDADAFFASCEQAIHPQYRGKPVITGKERGIVAAASYEAKAMGITRGVSLYDVKKICPSAIILPSDYETYSLFSKRMFEIMKRFTPSVEEYSIDEAFLDITGFQRPYHATYSEIALKIKETIESELGITVSVGLSLSKVLAKIGSKYNKPAGFTPISGMDIVNFLEATPVEKIWGIGAKTAAYCGALGIKTSLDFALKSQEFILEHFTKLHFEIWQELRGKSVLPIVTEEKSDYASISKTKTFTPPSSDPAYVFAQLMKNLENACIKARRHNLAAKSVTVFIKSQDYKYAGMEAGLSRASAYPPDMVPLLRAIFAKIYKSATLYRATGIVLTGLQQDSGVQLDLFEQPLKAERLQRIYQAVDELALKFGKHKIYTGASAKAHQKQQHLYDRGDIPWRKTNRLKGESPRKHLRIPVLEMKA